MEVAIVRHSARAIICVFSILFLIGFSLPAVAQGEKKDDLIGHWTFEKGVELKDLTGHFGDIEFKGAEVKDGKLHIGDSKWAMTTGYKGPNIGPDKTLIAWIYLDDLNITHGAPLAVNKSSGDTFDAIVYAEKHAKHWMAGSSHFRRTHNDPHGNPEKETGKLMQLAISYEDVNNN